MGFGRRLEVGESFNQTIVWGPKSRTYTVARLIGFAHRTSHGNTEHRNTLNLFVNATYPSTGASID